MSSARTPSRAAVRSRRSVLSVAVTGAASPLGEAVARALVAAQGIGRVIAIDERRGSIDGVTAWVVPGSETVKRQAEAEGLDALFREAGFAWREPGCSMCVAANGERVPPGARSISTSNRNFVGRQGPSARTHLASPTMAAAAAVTGCITDVRQLG